MPLRARLGACLLLLLLPWLLHAEETVTPAADRRAEDQTFLTYPEWFLVFSPEEYAAYLEDDGRPSEFPWLGHLRQFWQAYGALSEYTAARYPHNGEYHTMIRVIGVSTSVEYGVRGAYELLIGRVTELARGDAPTPEDRFSAAYARDYVDFLDLRPWYEFDFASRLGALWAGTPWFGPDMLRKWERRYLLTSELAAKAIYAKLIGFGAASSFEKPVPETVVLVSGLPADASLPPDVTRRLTLADGRQLLSLPRYGPFTSRAAALVRQGADFVEIAGNRDNILVTGLAVPGARMRHDVMFRQPILTGPGRYERIAVVVPVADLDTVLLEFAEGPVEMEHIYDY